MRRLLYAFICVMALNSTVGCVLPIYHADPQERTRQLIFTSENMRAILLTWERFWFLDQPDHMSPQRTHGGVI